MWALGQPDNVNETENCAQLVVYKENSTVLLEDRHCGVVSALACKVILNIYHGQYQKEKTLFRARLLHRLLVLHRFVPILHAKKMYFFTKHSSNTNGPCFDQLDFFTVLPDNKTSFLRG
jgi:hypothetical protein